MAKSWVKRETGRGSRKLGKKGTEFRKLKIAAVAD